MRRLSTLLLLIFVSALALAQSEKPLKITHFSYTFGINQGYGENGRISFLGRGFSGTTAAGTDASFANGNDFLPGETLEPTLLEILLLRAKTIESHSAIRTS